MLFLTSANQYNKIYNKNNKTKKYIKATHNCFNSIREEKRENGSKTHEGRSPLFMSNFPLGRCLPQAVQAYSGTRRGCPQRSSFLLVISFVIPRCYLKKEIGVGR